MKIFWVTATNNHYKARFLNKLAMTKSIDITMLCGSGRVDKGDKELNDNVAYQSIQAEPVLPC